jgi:hypothetical protein
VVIVMLSNKHIADMICDVMRTETCHWTTDRRHSKCDVGGCYFDTQTHSYTDV